MSAQRTRPGGWPGTWLLLGLVCLLGWEASGLDLAVSAWAGGLAGFPLRQAGSWASQAHTLGRWFSGLLLLALGLDALWPSAAWRAPAHRTAQALQARRWVAFSTLGVVLAVPALKRVSATSCPWDLAVFGGQVPYVPHWWLDVVDGGPGHCFPSGHAVGALAFLVPALARWRQGAPGGGLATATVLLAGLVFGGVQVLRGAHHASHVLWSAWLCAAWAVASDAAAAALRRRASAPAAAPAARGWPAGPG